MEKLREIINNHQIGVDYPLLRDFHTYLTYLMGKKIRIDSSQMELPRKELLTINLMMSPPEKPREALGSEPFPRLRLFYVLALILELIELDEHNLIIQDEARISKFFSLPPEEQYLSLLINFWTRVPWGCPHDENSDWDERYAYLTAFTCCPVNREIFLDDSGGDSITPILEGRRLRRIWPDCGPFLTFIMPNLRNFGLLDYNLKDNNQSLAVKSLTITSFGEEIFSCFHYSLLNQPEYFLREAWDHLEKKDFAEAQKIAQDMLSKDRYYPDTYNILGVVSLEEKDYEQAMIYYKEAWEKARLWLGLNFRESFSFQLPEKRRIFLQAQLGLAKVYRAQENWLIAWEILRDILELDPDDPLGIKFLLKDTEKRLKEKE